jgi:hypothetical protein
MSKLILIAAALALTLPAIAIAQTAAPAPTVPAAKPPVATAPVTAAPTTGSPTPADQAKRAETSPEEQAARAKVRAACSADVAKYCAEAAPVAGATPDQMKAQRGKTRACLTANATSLSTECKSALAERDKSHDARKN